MQIGKRNEVKMPKTADECEIKQLSVVSPYYPGGDSSVTKEQAIENIKELIAAVQRGEKVYVRFFNNIHKRINSIQRVKSVDCNSRSFDHVSYISGAMFCFPEDKKTGELSEAYSNKRKSRVNFDSSGAEWLVGYDGPTINWKEKAPPLPKEIIESYDRIGRPMKVGEFVLYKHEYWKTTGIEFGVISSMKNVTRRIKDSRTGVTEFKQTTEVTVRRVRLSDTDEPLSRYNETVIRNHRDIFLLDSNTLNELLIRRLSAE